MSLSIAIRAWSVINGPAELPPALNRKLRRADGLTCSVAAAAEQALAGIEDRQEIGVLAGFGPGPMETGFRFIDGLLDHGEDNGSPTLFSHSVHNIPAGYAASLCGLQGPALTLTSFTWPFFSALAEAHCLLSQGRTRRALVLGGEDASPVMDDALTRDQVAAPWSQGAVAWLLEAVEAPSPGPILKSISVEDHPCDPRLLLSREGERGEGPGLPLGPGPNPLTTAWTITGQLPHGAGTWRITAPFGAMEMTIASEPIAPPQ